MHSLLNIELKIIGSNALLAVGSGKLPIKPAAGASKSIFSNASSSLLLADLAVSFLRFRSLHLMKISHLFVT